MFHLSPAEWTAVALSLRIAVVATACALPFGIAIGWLLARKQFWGKTLLNGLVFLPLVLPPVVTGYLCSQAAKSVFESYGFTYLIKPTS